MAEPHVVVALRDKRAELSGGIADLEKRIGQHRADLLHVDAVLRLFAPDLEPAAIPSKAVRQPSGWFRRANWPGWCSTCCARRRRRYRSARSPPRSWSAAGSTPRITERRNCCASWSGTPSTDRPPIWSSGSRTEPWSDGGCATDQAAWRLRCQ